MHISHSFNPLSHPHFGTTLTSHNKSSVTFGSASDTSTVGTIARLCAMLEGGDDAPTEVIIGVDHLGDVSDGANGLGLALTYAITSGDSDYLRDPLQQLSGSDDEKAANLRTIMGNLGKLQVIKRDGIVKVVPARRPRPHGNRSGLFPLEALVFLFCGQKLGTRILSRFAG